MAVLVLVMLAGVGRVKKVEDIQCDICAKWASSTFEKLEAIIT